MAETFPQLLLERAAQYGELKVALREKEFGIWQATTWQTYAARFRNKFPELVIVPPTSGPNTFEVAVHTEDNVRAVYAWMSAWLDELGHGEGFPGAMEGRARG